METSMKENGNKRQNVTIEKEAAREGMPGGEITLSEGVVATIAGLAAREVDGIHELGKWRFMSFGDNPTRGVGVEVGKKQAAFDLDVVIDYGCDIRTVASELRQRIAREVDKMARRETVEVNIHVVDLHVPTNDKQPKESPRVI